MIEMEATIPKQFDRLYKLAFGFAVFTIVFNVIEGSVATYFGFSDESLALFGFGIDSFIEVISGIGIAHLVWRTQKSGESQSDDFERTALRITGFAFYALVIGLSATAFYNIWAGNKPETTFWGVVVSIISILVMWALIVGKKSVGRQLDSDAILADAECTRVCVYMSVILLASSLIFELTSFAYIDIAGTLGIAYLAFREGRECFEKAAGKSCCAC